MPRWYDARGIDADTVELEYELTHVAVGDSILMRA